jgi:hypothetical protein
MNALVKSFQVLQDDIRKRNESALTADSIKALASIADILVGEGYLQIVIKVLMKIRKYLPYLKRRSRN